MKAGILVGIAASMISFGALAAGTSAVTHPAPSSARQQASFHKLDRNRDGAISRSEAQQDPKLKEEFSKADKNGDGKVERGEFARFELHSQGGSGTSNGGSGTSHSGNGMTK